MNRFSTQRFALHALLAVSTSASAQSPAPTENPPSPSASEVLANFGFPMTFSTAKMDATVDPRKDYLHYAAGKWLAAAQIPSDATSISQFYVLIRQIDDQLRNILIEAAARSGTAPKGTPLQQVGDFFASGMDVEQLRKLGVSPLRPELDRIDAVKSPATLSAELAHLGDVAGEPILFGVGVSTDPQDRSRYAVYFVDAPLTLASNDLYLKPDYAAAREAYVTFVTDMLTIAGTKPDQAKQDARRILEMEVRIAGKKLTPVEATDPRKRFVAMPYSELRALLSNADIDAYFAALGLPPGGNVVVSQVEALRERNALLATTPLNDTRLLMRWSLLVHTVAALTPEFDGPVATLNRAIVGQANLPPRTQRVTATLRDKLGHPLSQLYVKQHFSPEAKKAAEDLIGRIRAEFRSRLAHNDWLTEKTRLYAIEKLDKADIRVGYPDTWIDYSSVDIRRDDFLGNTMRVNTFLARRDLAKLGKPVREDEFSVAGATLPIDVNAALRPSANGIEIPAAFLQPPFYDPKADAAVNFCAVGAVIGHELTHDFDSQGRLYDAQGNVRDWWDEGDSQKFTAETAKLIHQAEAFDVLPGLHLNGQLTVTENLADIGGITLAYEALQKYFAEHPEQRKPIDDLAPDQRCFLSWAQLWASKSREEVLRQITATDTHSDGSYRVIAPVQHVNAFYGAFNIHDGDASWLDPKERVHIW